MTRENPDRKIVIIAGPNGAGKTTFAMEFLANEGDCDVFLNADLIARGLSPFAPETAAIKSGRIMLELIDDNVRLRQNFAFETTLSGLSYSRHIPRWRAVGYHVKLVFLSLPSADLAVERVKSRVEQGGHSIEEAVIRRRFESGLKNFHQIYRGLVNDWALYDNAGAGPILLKAGVTP